MAWRKVPLENVEAFSAALPPAAGVELRKMFGCPTGFVSGNIFCGAHQEDILIRLDEAEREKALKRPGFKRFEPRGKPMREYVCIPAEMTADVAYLKRWFMKSLEFASTLPPKEKKPRKKKARKSV